MSSKDDGYQARIWTNTDGTFGAYVQRHGIPITFDHKADTEEEAADWARARVEQLRADDAARAAGKLIDL